MRPRGDAISRPVTRYVGQCGRHSPHDTHDDELVRRRGAAVRVTRSLTAAAGPGASLPVGIERVLDPAHQLGVRERRGRSRRSPSPPASRSIQPSCVVRDRAAPASTAASSPATCTVPTPSSAHQRAPGIASSARRERGQRAGRDRDAAAVRARPAAPAASLAAQPAPTARRRRPRRPRAASTRARPSHNIAAARKRSSGSSAREPARVRRRAAGTAASAARARRACRTSRRTGAGGRSR